MELNPADVKLKVLVLKELEDFTSSETSRREAFKRLVVSLQQSQLVNKLIEVEEHYYFNELDHLREYLPGGGFGSYNINTIFIDPLPSPTGYGSPGDKLEEVTEFIFTVRRRCPGVVFVFYTDFKELDDQKEIFYAGKRSSFTHYYKLDRKLVGQEFDAALANILRACRDYVADYKRYHVALSFAGEDRNYAEALAEALRSQGLDVFIDSYEKTTLWGMDLYTYLSEIYQHKARYCVMFLSRHYAAKLWTNHERKAAQARAFSENKEYILPVRLDNTEIPGISPTIAYLSWPPETAETIADAIMEKLGRTSSKP